MGPGDSRPTRAAPGWVIETIVSPFRCFYHDALDLHTLSRLRAPHSEAEASRLARAAVLLYLAAAEALVHQAAVELGQHELARIIADPRRPLPLREVWSLLPAVIGAPLQTPATAEQPPPWPQFAELVALRDSWLYPGPPDQRRAYYQAPRPNAPTEPLQPHQAPAELGLAPDALVFPRTGLPRDPYALRPNHLDTVRAVLDEAVAALDRRLGGALTSDARHRKEPVRQVYPRSV